MAAEAFERLERGNLIAAAKAVQTVEPTPPLARAPAVAPVDETAVAETPTAETTHDAAVASEEDAVPPVTPPVSGPEVPLGAVPAAEPPKPADPPKPTLKAPSPKVPAPPVPKSSKGEKVKKLKKKPHRRAKGDNVVLLQEAERAKLPTDFPKGTHRLLGAQMTQEAALKVNEDPLAQEFLSLPMYVDDSEREGLPQVTRRGHMYVGKDVAMQLIKDAQDSGPRKRFDVGCIDALNNLAKDREWIPSTLASKAQDLFGFLERLDQYTNMKPINLPKLGSFWKDASKVWLKKVCGHTPTRLEVSPTGMMAILRRVKTRLPVTALTALCWCTTGRPYNWLYVKKVDVKIEKETEQKKREDAVMKKSTWDPKTDPLGYSVYVIWRDHKTVGSRQAFTTHSWLKTEIGEKVKKWYDAVQGDWLFPKSMWTDLKAGLAAALKEENADWDLKALRRGSLSTMARAAVPMPDLKLFSGHKSDATLLRYLGWGVNAKEHQLRGEAAAKALLPFDDPFAKLVWEEEEGQE